MIVMRLRLEGQRPGWFCQLVKVLPVIPVGQPFPGSAPAAAPVSRPAVWPCSWKGRRSSSYGGTLSGSRPGRHRQGDALSGASSCPSRSTSAFRRSYSSCSRGVRLLFLTSILPPVWGRRFQASLHLFPWVRRSSCCLTTWYWARISLALSTTSSLPLIQSSMSLPSCTFVVRSPMSLESQVSRTSSWVIMTACLSEQATQVRDSSPAAESLSMRVGISLTSRCL